MVLDAQVKLLRFAGVQKAKRGGEGAREGSSSGPELHRFVLVSVDEKATPNLANVLCFELEKGLQELVAAANVHTIIDPNFLHNYIVLPNKLLPSPIIMMQNEAKILALQIDQIAFETGAQGSDPADQNRQVSASSKYTLFES